MSEKSQTTSILNYMQHGHSLTQLDALKMFGCMRLGARIYDLKQSGYAVVSTMIDDKKTGKRYASYSLV